MDKKSSSPQEDLGNYLSRELSSRNLRASMLTSILRIYILAGILFSFIGIVYFALTTLDIQLSFDQQIGLFAVVLGILLSIVSWLLLRYLTERTNARLDIERIKQKNLDFLRKWNKFELISKDILSDSKIDFNRASIREIIEALYTNGNIDRSDVFSLEEANQVRNVLVHGGGNLTSDITDQYSRLIDAIVSKISA